MSTQAPVWRKSTRSGDPSIGTCVELADLGDVVGIRDSKNPHLPHLAVSRAALADLLRTMRDAA